MALLAVFKPEQQPLELVFPRKGPLDTQPQGVEGFVEQPLASAFGGLAIARILFDVRNHTGIEDALPIAGGIKTAIEINIGTSQVYPDLLGHLLQGMQPLGQEYHIRFIDGSHWDGC